MNIHTSVIKVIVHAYAIIFLNNVTQQKFGGI